MAGEQHPKTVEKFIIQSAARYPDKGFGYIRLDGSVTFTTYVEILQASKRILAGLQACGLMPGHRLILSLDKNEEIVPSLWACLLGGIVPTLLQPPVSFTEHNAAAEKIEKVFQLFGKPHIVLSDSLSEKFSSRNIPQEKIIPYSALIQMDNDPKLPVIHEDDLAFVQFSSGSTGDPKGVMLTHQNLVTNIQDIIRGIHLTERNNSLNWMPLFHDMGMIGFLLTPTLQGCNNFLIETYDFIKKPLLWLDCMDKLKIAVVASPNFGLALVNRHLARKQAGPWDLSSVKTIMNGAEPISIRILNHFLDNLKESKLSRQAMLPCYGLAESTLATTFSPFFTAPKVVSFHRETMIAENRAIICSSPHEHRIDLVSVGKPLDHVQVRIVDEEEQEVPETYIGHIQIRGKNVTSGYFNDPEATAVLFSGGWLRTGDLGFQFGGDLFITGRFKDIIFVNSRNFYAHDMENLAMSIPEIVPGKIVIGGIFDEKKGMDRVIVFLVGIENETTRTLAQQIRDLFKSHLGIRVDHFILIKSSDIARTSSGKIQRYKLINKFQKREILATINV